MKRGLMVLGVALAVLFGVLVVRALGLKSEPSSVVETTKIALDEVKVADHLAAALRFSTVSYPEVAKRDFTQWLALHTYLEKTFPKAHKTLVREVVAKYSLLYTWPGADRTLEPIAFLAHQDVVPVAPGTEGQWTQPPFAGKVSGGFIWGRGALDDKAGLIALFEAIETLGEEGYRPKRTLIFAFGHDEEVGGVDGASAMGALLETRGIKLEAVVDEGGFIARGALPGVQRPVGLVGVAEKGYVSVEMISKAVGGHSSMPPSVTAIGQLADAVSRLEKHPLPASLRSPTREMLIALGPEMGFSKQLAFANLWLFEPLILRMLSASPPTNASIRTTTAPTIFQAGVKDNVLPASARAMVNFRIMPGETSETVVQHVKQTIQNEDIELTRHVHGEASAVSDTKATPYARLKSLIQSHFEGVLVVPFLTIASTDTKHYTRLTKNVYRFLPMPLGVEDVPRIHGVDERISVADYAGAIRFYHDAVKTLSLD